MIFFSDLEVTLPLKVSLKRSEKDQEELPGTMTFNQLLHSRFFSMKDAKFQEFSYRFLGRGYKIENLYNHEICQIIRASAEVTKKHAREKWAGTPQKMPSIQV